MMKRERLSFILEDCLNRILNDQETVDSVLAEHPEYEDKLRSEIEAALWLHNQRSIVELRPGYITPSRQRLLEQIKHEKSNPVIQKKPVLNWNRFVLRLALTSLFIVISILAYQAGKAYIHSSLPGDPLYDVKLTFEDRKLSMTLDAASQAALRIEMAEERAREVDSLLILGRYDDAEVSLEGYRNNLSLAADLISVLQDDSTRQALLAQELSNSILRHNDSFLVLIANGGLPENTLTMLTSTIVNNDQITQSMMVLMENIDGGSIPIQASLEPTSLSTNTPTPSPTYEMESFNPIKPEDTLKPSETPIPIKNPNSNMKTPTPSETPISPDPLDELEDDPDVDELRPTKKPSKTPKDKDIPNNRANDRDDNKDKDKDKEKENNKEK